MRAAGCLGATRCTAAPTADGHVSVPFFFFPPPPSAPFHTTALSFPPTPAPFPTAGAVEKGVGEGRGKEGAGGGAAPEPRPRRGPRPRGHCSSPSLSATPRGARSWCRHPERAPPPRPSCGSRAETSQGEEAQGTALHPFLRGSDSQFGVALLPWPRAGGGCSFRAFHRRGK